MGQDDDGFEDDGSSASSHEEEQSRSSDSGMEARESTRRSVVFSNEQPEEIPLSDVESSGSLGNKIVQRKNRRTSCVTDLATGKQGGARGQMAQLRSPNSKKTLSPAFRSRMSLMTRLRADTGGELPETNNNAAAQTYNNMEDGETRTSKQGRYLIASKDILSRRKMHVAHKQYCLQAVPTAKTRWQKLVQYGLNFEKMLIRFLHWTFRQSFPVVFLTAFIGFFSFTLGFGFLIWVSGFYQPECVGGPPYGDYETRKEHFMDAFVLSWTTFSTVGYGLIYSGISTDGDIDDVQKCIVLTVIVSVEAFVGVIFASICGAILFIKVARVQSFAQVIFSDIICIRFGTGVKIEATNDDDADEERSSDSKSAEDPENYPCPILEFRVCNRLHSIPGGEIIDCTVNVVASIDASQACHTVRDAARGRKKKRGGRRGGGARKRRPSDASLGGMMGAPTLPNLLSSSQPHLPNLAPTMSDLATPTQAVEEDPTGHLVPKRIISKLECLTHDHPFFKRVFILRHTLDHRSPLLTSVARQLVKRNQGLWPAEMNNAESVRNAIRFDHLLVSLSGTSNADANSVYAQTVYEFADLHLGYRFVNMLYRDESEGTLRVDLGLINDVMEQAGGGGEPLHHEDRHMMTEVPIL